MHLSFLCEALKDFIMIADGVMGHKIVLQRMIEKDQFWFSSLVKFKDELRYYGKESTE